MNFSRLLIIAILLSLAGCERREVPVEADRTPPRPVERVVSPDPDDPPGTIVYSTGEDIAWPSVDPPLMEISFDLPEVPEQILGPFSEDVIPVEE